MNYNGEALNDNKEHSEQSSPIEILKQMMAELGLLLQDRPQNGNIVINYYNSVGQHIDSVNTQNINGPFPLGKESKEGQKDWKEDVGKEDMPEAMSRAVEAAVREGLWANNQSWAVVYRVFQMRGYMGGMSEFVRQVKEWPLEMAATCSYDAVQKPIARGTMIGSTERWKAGGASKQDIALAEFLMKEIERPLHRPYIAT